MKKRFGHPRLSRIHVSLSFLLVLTLIIGLTPAISVQAKSIFYTPPSLTIGVYEAEQEQEVDLPVNADQATGAKVTVRVDPNKDTEIQFPSGKISLNVPQGAVSEAANIEIIERAPVASTGMKMLNSFELKAFIVASETEFSQFEKELSISIKHSEEELRGLDTSSLCLYYLDEQTRQWQPVPSQFDSNEMVLNATLTHFSQYGEQANPLINGPGKVMASQVNLHSGTATFSYPLELPPGPGGFTPSVQLNYNSGSVDEMKNKRSTASWVGIGWSLNFGSISHDLTTDEYYLNLNNGSYKIFTTDGTNYYTEPDQHFRIVNHSTYWEVWDRQGTYYTFGYYGNSYSRQYVYASSYRFDLDSITDTNNNTARIVYAQNLLVDPQNNSWVRSAYPEYLRYNNNAVEVHFITDWDEDLGAWDGKIRYDNPTTPLPKVMEDRRLDTIEVKYNGSLVRKYEFDYTTTARQYSSDYGGTYYSGKMTLDSITQKGADDTSTLPATSFTYTDLSIYYHGSGVTYTGNPGNAATITWPHLTGIDSGYGDAGNEITFSYTQKPGSNPDPIDIWTRQVVTAKTVNSGIGSSESYTYEYTGDPQYYLLKSPLAEYRGFSQVKENTVDNSVVISYVKHYFYTTGIISGKDAEKLTGREYKTEWYNSAAVLQEEKDYDWSCNVIGQGTAGRYISSWNRAASQNDYITAAQAVAVSADGYVYVAETSRIIKYDYMGNYVATWSGGYIQNVQGVAVNYAGYVYVAETNRIVKYDSNGTYVTSWNRAVNQNDYLTAVQCIAVSADGYVYVGETTRIIKYDASGNYITYWIYTNNQYHYLTAVQGVAVSTDGYVYVGETTQVIKYSSSGTYITSWTRTISQYHYLSAVQGVAVSLDNYVYVVETTLVTQYDSSGNYVTQWNRVVNQNDYLTAAKGIATFVYDYVYVVETTRAIKFSGARVHYDIQLKQVDDIVGAKTSRIRYYTYDTYGNVTREYHDGDISTNADDSTVYRVYYVNGAKNILDKPARERTYATIMGSDSGGANLKEETVYYYDGYNQWNVCPDKGNLTWVQQSKDPSNTISTYFTYDAYGNRLTEQDPNGNTTTWTYDATYHTYPATKTYPTVSAGTFTESYTYDSGTNNMLTMTDMNGQTTTYYYDTFKRLTKVVKPGDTEQSPSIEYQYNSWGTINSQNIKTITKVDGSTSLWQADYFDGLGRVVQSHASGETGHTIISTTTTYNTSGLMDKQYVTQDIASILSAYQAPGAGWKYTTYAYDALGRVTTQTNPDGTTIGHDYSTAWQDLVTNQRNKKTRYYYDAFQQLVRVEELDDSYQVYATTNYTYDILGNLTQVVNNSSNTTSITYDWLSRKTGMTDPDMGAWSYGYDSNGNLTSQTDALTHTISMTYDALNRITAKTYPAGLGMTNIGYTYDSTTSGNIGIGRRTGMTDALGTTSYKYDARGRTIEEVRAVTGDNSYTTSYTYDGADRIATVTYPTGETVTQTYDDRGLPDTVSGSVVGGLVTSTLYNALGQITDCVFGNNTKTTYGYYGEGGDYDTTGDYWGKLWEIKTIQDPDGTPDELLYMRYTWDAGGNMLQRQDFEASQTENFTYDFLDRLTGVSGAYTESYSYSSLGNITTHVTSIGTTNYFYDYADDTPPTKPHAVTRTVINDVTTNYAYDANGNMTTHGNQTITFDLENRPVTITEGANTSTFVYDGDGTRVKKTESGSTILYVNKYYEKNITTGEVTTSYYNGSRLVAQYKGSGETFTLSYIHQDSLNSTSLTTNTGGTMVSSMAFYPFGDCRNSQGTTPTDKKFTGQRLDGTGLYYYGARYYDPSIGRFISADSLVQLNPDKTDVQLTLAVSYSSPSVVEKLNQSQRQGSYYKGGPFDPQLLNRYSYARNNPLKYNDSSGHWLWAAIGALVGAACGLGAYALAHQNEEFNWGEAAIWAGGGALIGATLGGAAEWVLGSLAVRGSIAAASAMTTQASSGLYNKVDFLNRMNHVLQARHCWGRLVNLTGDLEKDFTAVNPYIEIAINTGEKTLDPRSAGSFSSWIYTATINGQTVIVQLRQTEKGMEFVDAWVKR